MGVCGGRVFGGLGESMWGGLKSMNASSRWRLYFYYPNDSIPFTRHDISLTLQSFNFYFRIFLK